MLKFTSTENEIHTQLMLSNNAVGHNFGNINRASGTQTVIVSAQKGDSVYVRHHEALGTTPQAYPWTRIFLIFWFPYFLNT